MRVRDAFDEPVVTKSVGDEVGDGDHAQVVPLAEGSEIGYARHRAVIVHDLADHAGRGQASEACQVDASLGLTRSLEDTTALGLQWEDVARLDEISSVR